MTVQRFDAIIWRGPLGRKVHALTAWLEQRGSVLVGFSGGVDSTFLSALAAQVLGKRTLAVTLDSPFLARSELREARRLARLIGVRHRVVRVEAFDDPQLVANPPDRCYHCKRLDFGALCALAREAKLACVCDGSNADDRKDYRPGSRATTELGVLSPLQELGFSKAQIRAASRRLRLPTADKPAMACLASRIPYGTAITAPALRMIEQAEDALRGLGLTQCRVRLHGEVARIEVPPADLARVLAHRRAILARLTAVGLRFITLDLQGYRMGSLNESLTRA